MKFLNNDFPMTLSVLKFAVVKVKTILILHVHPTKPVWFPSLVNLADIIPVVLSPTSINNLFLSDAFQRMVNDLVLDIEC